jgi:hypothetical protein
MVLTILRLYISVQQLPPAKIRMMAVVQSKKKLDEDCMNVDLRDSGSECDQLLIGSASKLSNGNFELSSR